MTKPHADGAICDTTNTPRRFNPLCICDTYEENLGPCLDGVASYEEGMNGRCAYCDHTLHCHGQPTVRQLEEILDEAEQERGPATATSPQDKA